MSQSFIKTINVNFPGLGRAINFSVVKYNRLMFPCETSYCLQQLGKYKTSGISKLGLEIQATANAARNGQKRGENVA